MHVLKTDCHIKNCLDAKFPPSESRCKDWSKLSCACICVYVWTKYGGHFKRVTCETFCTTLVIVIWCPCKHLFNCLSVLSISPTAFSWCLGAKTFLNDWKWTRRLDRWIENYMIDSVDNTAKYILSTEFLLVTETTIVGHSLLWDTLYG